MYTHDHPVRACPRQCSARLTYLSRTGFHPTCTFFRIIHHTHVSDRIRIFAFFVFLYTPSPVYYLHALFKFIVLFHVL